jgi:hypothetical protein
MIIEAVVLFRIPPELATNVTPISATSHFLSIRFFADATSL